MAYWETIRTAFGTAHWAANGRTFWKPFISTHDAAYQATIGQAKWSTIRSTIGET